MQIRENRRNVAERGFVRQLEQEYSEHAEGESDFETDVPARRELQKSSREPTIAAAMVFEASIVREVRM